MFNINFSVSFRVSPLSFLHILLLSLFALISFLFHFLIHEFTFECRKIYLTFYFVPCNKYLHAVSECFRHKSDALFQFRDIFLPQGVSVFCCCFFFSFYVLARGHLSRITVCQQMENVSFPCLFECQPNGHIILWV
jgi:hypothetical protein